VELLRILQKEVDDHEDEHERQQHEVNYAEANKTLLKRRNLRHQTFPHHNHHTTSSHNHHNT